MKNFLLVILLLVLAANVSAQSQPKPYLFGIQDTTLPISIFLDSLDHAGSTNFVKMSNAIVRECTISFVPTNRAGFPERTGYIEVVSGKRISDGLKLALKSAQPGDAVYISNVKAFYMGRNVPIKSRTHYQLL